MSEKREFAYQERVNTLIDKYHVNKELAEDFVLRDMVKSDFKKFVAEKLAKIEHQKILKKLKGVIKNE